MYSKPVHCVNLHNAKHKACFTNVSSDGDRFGLKELTERYTASDIVSSQSAIAAMYGGFEEEEQFHSDAEHSDDSNHAGSGKKGSSKSGAPK